MPSVLIIGDSHVDLTPFAGKLKGRLEKAGWSVTRAGLGATTAGSWISGHPCRLGSNVCHKVSELPHGTDLLLICLGTNDAANQAKAKSKQPAGAEKTANRIVALAKEFGASRTIWILPPWQRGPSKWYSQQAMDVLYTSAPVAEAQGVELFDSRPATRALVEAGSGDGVHPGSKGAEAWADAVVAQVQAGPAKPGAASQGGISFGVVALLAAPLAAWLWSRRK